MTLILFEDKLGITSGYESIWTQLMEETRLNVEPIVRRSAWRKFGSRLQLVIRKGNRKSPGFNPDERTQLILRSWVQAELDEHSPTVVICMDPALGFLMNPNWDQATPDNLRGGVYWVNGVPFVGCLPLSAWHTKKSQKDIAQLNSGFTDKEEWEEEHSDMDSDTMTDVWIDPISVPYGRFVLRADLAKVSRINHRRKQGFLQP